MEEQTVNAVAEPEEPKSPVLFRLHRRDEYVPPVKTEPEAKPAQEEKTEGPLVTRRSEAPVGKLYPLLRLTRRSAESEEPAVCAVETVEEEPFEEEHSEEPASEVACETAPEVACETAIEAACEASIEAEACGAVASCSEQTENAAPMSASVPSENVPEAPVQEAQGRLGELEYTATAIEGAPVKRAFIYLPAGYSAESSYPVLYLLHGIGGDENEWLFGGNGRGECVAILDRLINEGRIEPCVVVFPNGRTCADFRNTASEIVDGQVVLSENVKGFYEFDRELRTDLIPAVEAVYAVRKDRAGRALAGLSMGGMQTINLGLMKCNDLFTSYGAFSFGPTTAEGSAVSESLAGSGYTVACLYLCCGDADELCIPIFREFTESFRAEEGLVENFRAVTVEGGAHDFAVWNRGLAEFLPLAFGKRS